MKYETYNYPNFVIRTEITSDSTPVYIGCSAGEFGCGCTGRCMKIIDVLTEQEVIEKNIKIVER